MAITGKILNGYEKLDSEQLRTNPASKNAPKKRFPVFTFFMVVSCPGRFFSWPFHVFSRRKGFRVFMVFVVFVIFVNFRDFRGFHGFPDFHGFREFRGFHVYFMLSMCFPSRLNVKNVQT